MRSSRAEWSAKVSSTTGYEPAVSQSGAWGLECEPPPNSMPQTAEFGAQLVADYSATQNR